MTKSVRLWRTMALTAALAAVPAVAAAQVAAGQLDNFENGTAQGWVNNLFGSGGALPLPMNIANGGPLGAGDNYLQVMSSGGQGPGSRLMTFNISTWPGNYLAAGIGSIRLDARNFGQSEIQLRIMLERVGAMGPTDIAISQPRTLLVGSAWQSLEFPLFGPNGLFAPPGGGTVNNALSQSAILRIYHAGPSGEPVPTTAILGLDNITAVAVPEPSTVVLFGMGALGLFIARRRRVGSK